MLNFLVGNNATGKTKYLRELLNSHVDSSFVTNMDLSGVLVEEKPIDGIISFLEDRTNSDIIERGTDLIFLDLPYKVSLQFKIIMYLLTRDVDYMFLDEPDEGLYERETSFLIDVYAYLSHLDKEVWTTTHDTGMLCFDNSNLFMIKNDILVSVDRREAIDNMV